MYRNKLHFPEQYSFSSLCDQMIPSFTNPRIANKVIRLGRALNLFTTTHTIKSDRQEIHAV